MPVSKHNSGICVEDRETAKPLGHDSRFKGRDLNPGLLTYLVGVLKFQPQRSVTS
jgi:hypothetical protein